MFENFPDYNNSGSMAPLSAAVSQQATQTPPTGLTAGVAGTAGYQAPQVGGAGGAGAGGIFGGNGNGPGFFQQGGGAQMALGALQTIGSLWSAFSQQKLAKENLAFQKEAFNTNLTNSTQTYNTALEDRINARHKAEGKSAEETASYIDKNKL